MKKIGKIFLFLYLLVMIPTIDVKAEMYAIDDSNKDYEEVPNFYFLLGTHMYSSLLKIDYLEIIKAADSTGDNEPILYQKVFETWYDFDGNEAEVPNKDGVICISHIDGVELENHDCTSKGYTVKFENDVEPTINKEVSVNDGSKILAADVPTNLFKHGYKFVCWVDKENDSEDPAENCFDFASSITDDLTLVPYYEPITYTIKFDLNIDGDSETIENQICNIDSFGDCKLPTVNLVRKGYKFVGWSANNDEDSSNGTYYKAKESMIDLLGEDNTVTLYAVWEPVEFTITYNLNGGTFDFGVVVRTTFTDLNKDNIKLFTPAKTGFTFTGWKVDGEDEAGSVSTPDLESTNEYTLTINELKDITLVAEWDAKQYTITYKLGELEDGEELEPPESTTCVFNTNCHLEKAPERKGYEFAGWTDNNGYLYVSDKDFMGVDFESNEITLTAVWYNEFTSTITYELDGGYFAITPLSVVGKEQLESELPKPQKLGYKFDGWCKSDQKENCDSNKATTVKNALGEDGTLKDVTLYAMWEANTYTIEFNESPLVMALMSAEDGLNSVECTYGEECELGDHAAYFSEKHKSLKGWSYSYGDNAKAYFSDKMKVMNLTTEADGTVTLYAVTEDIKYTITYYLDGGQFDEEANAPTFATDNQEITIPTPTKPGYTFVKWVDEVGEDISLEESGKLTVTEDKFMVAIWKSTAESRVLFDFPDAIKKDEEFEFRIGYEANKNTGETVIAKVKIMKFSEGSEETDAHEKMTDIQYCSQYNEGGKTCAKFESLTNKEKEGNLYFETSSSTDDVGFPFSDLTNIFKAKFTEVGLYKVKIEIVKFKDSLESSNESLVSKEVIIEVKDSTE